jgi:hypothetical protein
MKCTDTPTKAAVERAQALQATRDSAMVDTKAARARAAGSPNERAIPANDKETR